MRFKVISGLTDRAVTTLALTSLYLCNRGMHSHPEYIEGREQLFQILGPMQLLDDMLDENIVARFGKRND